MSVLKRPVKKMLLGLSIFFGIALVFFVRVFGANSSGKTEFTRVSLLEKIGVAVAQADIISGGDCYTSQCSDDSDGAY